MTEKKGHHIRNVRNFVALAIAGNALTSSVVLPPNAPPLPSHSRSADKTQKPDDFIKLAFDTNLNSQQLHERQELSQMGSISGKHVNRLAHKISKDFGSRLNHQLSLLTRGSIDEGSFQKAIQEQVVGFVDYMKQQEAQGLPNLSSLALLSVLSSAVLHQVVNRKDFFKGKRSTHATLVVATTLSLVLGACAPPGISDAELTKRIDTQQSCEIAPSVATVTPPSVGKIELTNDLKPGIYAAGAIVLMKKDADINTILTNHFTSTIPFQILKDRTAFRGSRTDLPNNTLNVQQSILDFFLPDLSKQTGTRAQWRLTDSVTGKGEYASVLTDIGAGALTKGEYELVGLSSSVWQQKNSNIGRSILVVRKIATNTKYVLKIQPIAVAQSEIMGLKLLNAKGINASPVEIFMPEGAKHLSISIQPYYEGITVEELFIPTISKRMPTGVEKRLIQQFYLDMYRQIVLLASSPDENGRAPLIGDTANASNIILTSVPVTPATPDGLKLVVIDTNTANTPTLLSPIDGKFVVKGRNIGIKGIAGEVIKGLQAYMEYGLGINRDTLPDIELPKNSNITVLNPLLPGATANIKIVDDTPGSPTFGKTFEASVKNSNLKISPSLPNRVPLSGWKLFNDALNGLGIVAVGVGIGYEVYHQSGLGDTVVFTQLPHSNGVGRFGLNGQELTDFEDEKGITNMDSRIYNGWESPINYVIDTAEANAEWIRVIREQNNLPIGSRVITPELRLNVADPLGNNIALNNITYNRDAQGPYLQFSFPDCGIENQKRYIGAPDLDNYTLFSYKNDSTENILNYDEELANYVYHLTTYAELQKKLNEEVTSGRMVFAVPTKTKDIHGREATNFVYGVLVEGEDGKPNMKIYFLTSKRIFDHPLGKVMNKSKSNPGLGAQIVVLERLQK